MSVYLRLKRKITDVPIDSLDTTHLSKRPCSDSNVLTFQYVGTQSVISSDFIPYVNHSARGKRKLILDNDQATLIEEDSIKAKICKIQPITYNHQSKVEISSKFEHLTVDPETDDLNDKQTKLSKVLDVFENDTSISKCSNLQSNDDEYSSSACDHFVYDLYKIDSTKVTNDNCWDDFCSYSYFDCENDEEVHAVDDEDDSNSESNWRNDYPDEDDFDQSCDDEDSHSTESCSSRSEFYGNYY